MHRLYDLALGHDKNPQQHKGKFQTLLKKYTRESKVLRKLFYILEETKGYSNCGKSTNII